MFDIITKNTPASLKNDILSGLTVALALVPEAVAFALIAQVHPLVGLYAAFMVGLITAWFGGRPGMISGAAGALAVAMVSLVAEHGVEYLFAAVILMGTIQILAGAARLGKFIRIVPHPVFLGFVNGLAIVIFLAQLAHFKVVGEDGGIQWMQGEDLGIMLGLVFLTMAIIHFLPRFTKVIPSTLAAILAVSAIVIGFNLDTRTVGDMASIGGGLPDFHIPMVPLTLETLSIILPYSLIFAAIGLIESLLTMSLLDELTETRGQGNRVCYGQGLANIVTGFFGGMGGCAMVGQSVINVESGGRSRISGIAAALFLLVFIVFASNLIEQIPLAALVGVMFIVVIGTFEWSSFSLYGRVPLADNLVRITVALVTVATDLAIAVFVGVIVSALVFAWQQARHIWANKTLTDVGIKVYEVHGPLFFASTRYFQEIFHPEKDPNEIIVDFKFSRVSDHSGIEAIDTLADRYLKAGRILHIRHLSPECRQLLQRAGDLVEVNIMEDPRYHVADDKLGG